MKLILIIKFLIIGITLMFYGACDNMSKEEIIATLTLKNHSDKNIFPIVIAQHEENFGGVSVRGSKTVGFATFQIGTQLKINWIEEQLKNPDKVIYFDMSNSLSRFKGKFNELIFIYEGKNSWKILIFNSQNNQILETIPCLPYDGELSKEARKWD